MLILVCKLRSIHCLVFDVSICCGPFCRSSGELAICASSSNDDYWWSAQQWLKVLRVGWVTSSTNRALRYFSSNTDWKLSFYFHNSCATSVGVNNCLLRLPTLASNLLYCPRMHRVSEETGWWWNKISMRLHYKIWWSSPASLAPLRHV